MNNKPEIKIIREMDLLYTAHSHNHKCVDLDQNKSDITRPDGMRGKQEKKKKRNLRRDYPTGRRKRCCVTVYIVTRLRRIRAEINIAKLKT